MPFDLPPRGDIPVDRPPPSITRQFTPQLSALLNRPIERPMWMRDVYGSYEPDTRRIRVEQGAGGRVMRHELLHAIQNEWQPFSADRDAGFPSLRQAMGNEGLPTKDGTLNDQLERDSWHVFLDLAEAYLDSRRTVPPPLAHYLRPLTHGQRPEPRVGPR